MRAWGSKTSEDRQTDRDRDRQRDRQAGLAGAAAAAPPFGLFTHLFNKFICAWAFIGYGLSDARDWPAELLALASCSPALPPPTHTGLVSLCANTSTGAATASDNGKSASKGVRECWVQAGMFPRYQPGSGE